MPSGLDRHYACARCGSVLLLASEQTGTLRLDAAHDGRAVEAAPRLTTAPPMMTDLWELGEQLRHVERVLGIQTRAATMATEHKIGGIIAAEQVDMPAALAPGDRPRKRTVRRSGASSERRHRLDRHHRSGSGRNSKPPQRSLGALLVAGLSWLLLSVGLSAFTCGAVLCSWGLFDGRDDLWNIGLPILLFSQAALLIGLVLQLDSRSSKQQADNAEHDVAKDVAPRRRRRQGSQRPLGVAP